MKQPPPPPLQPPPQPQYVYLRDDEGKVRHCGRADKVAVINGYHHHSHHHHYRHHHNHHRMFTLEVMWVRSGMVVVWTRLPLGNHHHHHNHHYYNYHHHHHSMFYLRGDEGKVRHGGRVDKVAVNHKADLYRIRREGHHIGKGTH